MSKLEDARMKLRGELEAPPALRRFGSGWTSGVLGLVLGDVARIAAPAALLGLATALGLSRLLRAMLYGVAPSDPLTYFAAGSILCGLAALAALGPARRAMRIDPAVALREE